MLIEGVSRVSSGSRRLDVEELHAQYRAYRTRQARRLVRLLPREAVRPLYRRALRLGVAEPSSSDPLSALVSYCEKLLPLPPFGMWRSDFEDHPDAHLADLDDSADAPTADAPATLEARCFEHEGRPWVAHLRSFRDGSTWRGFIAFQSERTNRVHRTALVFRESDPIDVRERFLGFEASALRAFLRSSLP